MTVDRRVDLAPPRRQPAAGPLDDRFYDLVEARFRRLVARQPGPRRLPRASTPRTTGWATATRDAVLGEIADDRAHLAAIEAIDPAGLSPRGPLRARPRDPQRPPGALRRRRASGPGSAARPALDALGDALFLLFARDFAPLAERLDVDRRPARGASRRSSTQRADPGGRPAGPAVAASSRSRRPAELPGFFDEIVAAGPAAPRPRRAAPPRARRDGARARRSSRLRRRGCEGTLAGGTDDWALGRERYDELVGLRAFDGLDADAILEHRLEQLRRAAGRARRGRARDRPDASTRRRSSTGSSATTRRRSRRRSRPIATRCVRARAHLIERDLVTVPADERIEVIATPEYLRNVMPFAAYFAPAEVRRRPEGHLRRHAVGRRRPGRDARAQLRLDQQHQHPRGLPGPPPPADVARRATRR